MVNKGRIKKAFTSILEAVGENPSREGLKDTPRRIADMYADIFSGLDMDPRDALIVGFDEGHHEMVILKDIPFYSMCEHHFLPFFGLAHVGYIPKGRIAGASKVARAVDILAKRPQLQERLTTQIAEAMVEALKPNGVAVVIEAEHMCMTMRGVKKPRSKIVTSAMRGIFRENPATRAEFMSLLQER
ncbi:MAG: GTP cyclohydrolase I FolE [Dehalococcoidia bacterium]|nr:GTP cyclohydrolase I FolE [Dehalococcoidia bacterium]